MRVAVLTPGVETGAFATIARNLASGLLGLGADVDVLYLQGPRPSEVEHFPSGTALLRLGRRSSTCAPAVARHVRQRRPDALISLGWVLNPAAVVAVALARTRTAVLLNEQSNLSYKSRVEHRASPRLRLLGHLAPVVYPRAAAVVGVSPPVVADLVDTVGIDPRRVLMRVVPNSVDAGAVVAAAREADPDVITGPEAVFVNVARHARQKDIPLLLRGFRDYLRRGNAGTLVLVGTGPLTDDLRDLAAELGIAGAVRFRGHVRNPFPQVAAATAFVLSSEEEGFGLVLVEAMALGVPVIATDCPGGPRDVLRDGRDGLLVRREQDALTAAMERVALDDGLREELSAAGRRRAGDFAPLAVARLWLDVLAESTSGDSVGEPVVS